VFKILKLICAHVYVHFAFGSLKAYEGRVGVASTLMPLKK